MIEEKEENLGFGNRLRTYLQNEGITDSAFAKSINRTVGIGRFEKNPDMLPKTSMILEITKQYPHWSIPYILFGKGEPYPPENNQQKADNDDLRGHFESLAKWMSVREDLSLDMAGLPLEGYPAVLEQLQDHLEKIGDENDRFIATLFDLLASYP